MFHENPLCTVSAMTGEVFEIQQALWQKNQQQQRFLLRYFALPLQEDEKQLWLGVDSLANLSACDAFSFLTNKHIEPVLLSTNELKRALQQLSPPKLQVEENIPTVYQVAQLDSDSATDEPLIQLLDQVFERALQLQASDIHFEPQQHSLQVRFRIDGVLQVQPPFSGILANRLISRLKLLAKLDISETRLPQDGCFQFKTTFSDTLDFRLSTLPTHLGEKAVLRLQRNKPIHLSFAELGMTADQQHRFQHALSQPQGLILVTGPTGSGKSISLYSALAWLNSIEKHILTAEDPIEIALTGIIQTQVNTQIGLDFKRLLRTFLRQDPDIIMLGEIRDEESALIALRAAQTGHLVLSTLHTNDAPSALTRLQQLGVPLHEIEQSLLLVVAQRLLRRRCCDCRVETQSACRCYQGYKGRIGVYQFLQKDKTGCFVTDFSSLRESAKEKVRLGMTDDNEVQRVLGE
ncbi:GspE/PulE family protein [Pasteurella multocida]|uniref:GspE/PulE family protein n=2 Tax=Gammaproteobacteria TaxID=1236 RepID=UPI0028DE0A45|nr:type II/IV secretion system protein [Pasteurella multocida]HDR1153727.1 type II/IV secretion system protein [Pasteurella multocida]HDR1164118.1 type II/IV secretion system protein [Pasteurella multocida]HDR1508743.1 type II/IV secretion system protein [Pasteurella multocida]HEA3314709.1 type II/IV secretion system protein [Pasteurella multocida]